jgi:hypothetical protein
MWEVRWFVGNEPSRFISLVDLFSVSETHNQKRHRGCGGVFRFGLAG